MSTTVDIGKLEVFFDEIEELALSYGLRVKHDRLSVKIDYTPLIDVDYHKPFKNSEGIKVDVEKFREAINELEGSSRTAKIKGASAMCGVSLPTLAKIYKSEEPIVEVHGKVADAVTMILTSTVGKNQRMIERVSRAINSTDKDKIAEKIMSNHSILNQTDFTCYEEIIKFIEKENWKNATV